MGSLVAMLASGCSCGSTDGPTSTAEPGVVFAYPADGQLDVPLGTRIIVSFSDDVDAEALGACSGSGASVSGAFCVVGPDGPVSAEARATEDGRGVELTGGLEPNTTYEIYVREAIAPGATNLPDGPLVTFTTRALRPRATAPTLVAINGSRPEDFAAEVGAFRPFFETSTIRLVFSEPLDQRSVVMGPGAFELVDTGSGVSVPAAIVSQGIHVAIDPVDDLVAGNTYELRLGGLVSDLGGDPLSAAPITIVPSDSLGDSGPIPQILRTRGTDDPGPAISRAGATPNVIHMIKPLIGEETITMQDGSLNAELGDPDVLGGPIAFTIRRGERLVSSGLDVQLGGEIPAGLSTGDIEIQFLTDANGRIYRSPFQAAEQIPDNERALLYVDLTFDVAITARDPVGNAALSQTVLGVQATGTAIPTEGVLAIETVAALDMSLLGVTTAPTNMVLELITDPEGSALPDRNSPTLVATFPADGADDVPVGAGLELTFDEPLDIERIRSGALRLEDSGGGTIATTVEQHGSVVVLRPLARLDYDAGYTLVASEVTDMAGNSLGNGGPILSFTTPVFENTDVPASLLAVHPGAPCALTSSSPASPGRCDFGEPTDDLYAPFTLPANQAVEIELSQPLDQNTVVLSGQCNTGHIRIEALDAPGGTCVNPVPGTFMRRERGFSFIPDVPWQSGAGYRLVLISGDDEDCDQNELCGANDRAVSFDVLDGTEENDGGGEDLVIDFVGADASEDTFVMAAPGPFSDVNGSGFIDGNEVLRDSNRAALRIVSVEDDVDDASFDMEDCLPNTPEVEGCMYIFGAMPVAMGELERDCPLPGGGTAASCLPVNVTPQVMYATSTTLESTVGITLNVDTGTTVMRMREPADGSPLRGYIIDDGGSPAMVMQLDLYMDAPDMSIILSDHDLISKPVSLNLRGPVSFLPDGRIVINLANVDDVPVKVSVDTPLGDGAINMIVPQGEMKLQLVSALLRGRE